MTKMRLTVLGAALFLVALWAPFASGANPPSLTSNPARVNFGTIDAATTASRPIVFTNAGGTATRSLAATLTGSTAFSITANTCTATSLGQKKSCNITVLYAPTGVGHSDTGTLTLAGKNSPASKS